MNDLNSVILEGVLFDKDDLSQTFIGTKVLNFKVKSVRTYKDRSGSERTETGVFYVRCFGNLANIVNDKAKKDTPLRIVGKLKEENERVVLIAEHVEIRYKHEEETDSEKDS